MGQAIFFTGPDSPVYLQQAMFPASSSSDTLTFLFIIDRRTKGGECTREREKEYYNTEEHIPCEPIHSSTPHARGVIDFRTTSSHTMPNTIYYLFVFLSWQLWLSGRCCARAIPTPSHPPSERSPADGSITDLAVAVCLSTCVYILTQSLVTTCFSLNNHGNYHKYDRVQLGPIHARCCCGCPYMHTRCKTPIYPIGYAL